MTEAGVLGPSHVELYGINMRMEQKTCSVHSQKKECRDDYGDIKGLEGWGL